MGKRKLHGAILYIYVVYTRYFSFGARYERRSRDGAALGGSVSSVNVTFFSIHDFQPRPLARPGQTLLADWNNTTTAEPSLYC